MTVPVDAAHFKDVLTETGVLGRVLADLDLLALWTVHTWLVAETYTTPRLLFDSPVPGSGKTTAPAVLVSM